MPRLFCRHAHGALIVVDLSEKSVLHNTLAWKAQIDENAVLPDGSSVPVLLVGNKLDLLKTEEIETPDPSANQDC